jgi:hypothetical protein
LNELRINTYTGEAGHPSGTTKPPRRGDIPTHGTGEEMMTYSELTGLPKNASPRQGVKFTRLK